ncbi:MAG: glucan biosynthesis protein D, partial [Comamonadaceae bacterium]
MTDRRTFLAGGIAAALAALGLPEDARAQVQAQTGVRLGQPMPFSFDALVEQARQMAAQPPLEPAALPRDILERIGYEEHGRIKYKSDHAVFKDGPGAFPLTFFHLGRYFQVPVHMHVLERSGGDSFAREVLYDPSYFDMPPDSPARGLPDGVGFAGFRFQESRLGDQQKLPWQTNDWVAFLGASYFRAIGDLYQYGLSARGVAIDVANPDRPEEFPNFTRFYFEPPVDDGAVTVHALLE